MAEITANFHGKDITITYPDALIGKAEEAFASIFSDAFEQILEQKAEKGIELSDDDLEDLKYQYTIDKIVAYVINIVQSYEVNKAVDQAKFDASIAVNSALDQINVKIKEGPSGPSFV